MSYISSNGYGLNPYNPQSAGQDARRQDSYQTSITGISQHHNHNHAYSSLNAQGSQYQQSYAPTSTATDRSTSNTFTSKDRNLPSSGQNQDGGDSFGYTTSRSTGDTGALGSLAYASSLNHDPRNLPAPNENVLLQQIIDYNRTRVGQDYSTSASYRSSTSSGYQYKRPNSYGAVEQRAEQAPKGHRSGQHSPTHSQPRYNTSTVALGNETHSPKATPSYRTSQAKTQKYTAVNDERRSNQPHLHHILRPTSGQIHHFPQRSPDTQASQSPLIPTYRSNKPACSGSGSEQHDSQMVYDHTTKQDSQLHSADHKSSHQEHPNQNSQELLTVDPSQVFNHVAYQRRQAAAAAEAAVAAKKARAEAVEAAATLRQVSKEAGSRNRVDDSSKEAEIAAEMRMMIEKMREVKKVYTIYTIVVLQILYMLMPF